MNVTFVARNLVLFYLGILVSIGCTNSGKKLNFYYDHPCQETRHGEHGDINITYLGAGGYLIKRGTDKLLISPFFSNPGMLRLALGKIRTKREIVDKYLPPVADVEAILVGHSHYDHLMDLPYIAEHHAKTAKIYVNESATRLLGPCIEDKSRLVSVNAYAGTGDGEPGKWTYIYNGRIRFMPVKSEHAPHYWGILFFNGKKPRQELNQCPNKASRWITGDVFSFIIDFLGPDSKEVQFRIHYQDSASNPPKGFPPLGIDHIDLAILCAASYGEVKNYPEGFLEKAKPKHIIVGHWENFFRSYKKPPRTVPFTNVKRFIKKVANMLKTSLPYSGCMVPRPGSCITYCIHPDKK